MLPRLQAQVVFCLYFLTQLNKPNAKNTVDPDIIHIIHDLFLRFGKEMVTMGGDRALHDIQKGLIGFLESSSAARRKKAVLCLG
jgi:hypothetical protein